MGYDELDLALMDAWRRAQEQLKHDPEALEKIMRRRGMAVYARPLRSWSLVLRANDKRIVGDGVDDVVTLCAGAVRTWCSPVVIGYPGVSLDEAAGLFGVNRTTVSRWAGREGCGWWQDVKRQMSEFEADPPPPGMPSSYRVSGRLLELEHLYNRANPKRSETRVWTPGTHGLDPGGEVWSADWGALRVGLAGLVPEGFEQELVRVRRGLGAVQTTGRCASPATRLRSRVWQWVCPEEGGGCGRLVYKVYLPLPSWTLTRFWGGVDLPVEAHGLWFRCQRCAGLAYESSERTSSPGVGKGGDRRRVCAMDRFVKRISGGVLDGGCLGL